MCSYKQIRLWLYAYIITRVVAPLQYTLWARDRGRKSNSRLHAPQFKMIYVEPVIGQIEVFWKIVYIKEKSRASPYTTMQHGQYML